MPLFFVPHIKPSAFFAAAPENRSLEGPKEGKRHCAVYKKSLGFEVAGFLFLFCVEIATQENSGFLVNKAIGHHQPTKSPPPEHRSPVVKQQLPSSL